MNQKQRNTLLVTAAIIALMVLFPPYVIKTRFGILLEAGYGFFANLPVRHGSPTISAEVNVLTLLIQIFGVLIVGGLVFWANSTEAVLMGKTKRQNKSRSTQVLDAKEEQQGEKQPFQDFDELAGQQYNQRQEKYDNLKSRTSGWLRLFARLFDVWWELLLVSYFLAFVLFRYSTGFVDWLGNTPNADKTFVLLSMPIALILDATIYSVFGNTPGKAWIGLKVKNTIGMSLDFSQYVGRNFKFYVSGFALGLPIIGLFPMIYQSIRLKRGQQASYDESTGFRVHEQPVGWIQKTTFGLAFVSLFLVMAALNSMGKNTQQASIPSTNQEISTQAIPPSVYQWKQF